MVVSAQETATFGFSSSRSQIANGLFRSPLVYQATFTLQKSVFSSFQQHMTISGNNDGFPFGGGEVGALMRVRDWSDTGLGPISGWPQSLKTTVGLVLYSPVPMVLLWGPDGFMIYNDAYSAFAGGRHPLLFGSKVREGWPEVADFNNNVMQVGLGGGTLSYRNQELTLHRNGVPEQVWMNLDYSPVLGDNGRPEGVLAIVVETTQQVLAERALAVAEERLRQALNASGMVGTFDWLCSLTPSFPMLALQKCSQWILPRGRRAHLWRTTSRVSIPRTQSVSPTPSTTP